MRAAGLGVSGGLELNSAKTVRCHVEGDREKRGWYRLSEILIEGESYLVGAYGIWRGNDNGKVAVRPGRKVKLTREQRKAISARIKADQAKARAQREAQGERAAAAAARVWRAYGATGHSDYLERKGVGAHGLRFHESGTVAVPIMDPKGKVWGLQIIRGQERGDKLEKQYWPKGMIKEGRYHLVGGSPRGLCLIAEGYATAASLHEATGLPCAVAFDAGNLLPVAQVLSKHYRGVRILICADDDHFIKMKRGFNPGVDAAGAAALAVGGEWLVPVFAAERPENRKGPTDFNDLHALEGLAAVRAQVEGHLAGVGWLDRAKPRGPYDRGGGGSAMVPRLSVDDAVSRYWGTYGMGGKVLFDEIERRLVHKDDVLNLLPRHGWEQMRDHPDWRVARDTEIGFDPTESDPATRCNLFGGWPTEPKEGDCTLLLELLEYLCGGEDNGRDVYEWMLDWLAYPLQHPGAKMRSAIVVHGPQGTGKSLFFETYGKIFGEYGRVLGQEALEDKFNSDWAEKQLFILADELLARQDMFHVKNRLKSFITGDVIRVNPKNLAAHNEKNQMNIVFLSNERRPLVLENDDRRHCVVWCPPKLPPGFFENVVAEVDSVAALHHHLLARDLGDFRPSTPPPMTASKQELIDQSVSSEERFVRDWREMDVEGPDGGPLPFCPCLGSHLYRAYERWCEANGERKRRMQDLIGHCGKLHGWSAGRAEHTWRSFQDKTSHRRKMIVPEAYAIEESSHRCQTGNQEGYRRDRYDSKMEWLTAGYFAFAMAMGLDH